MHIHLSVSRQRVPMIDASTLEDRTRPELDTSEPTRLRLRFYRWPTGIDGDVEPQTLGRRIRRSGAIMRS